MERVWQEERLFDPLKREILLMDFLYLAHWREKLDQCIEWKKWGRGRKDTGGFDLPQLQVGKLSPNMPGQPSPISPWRPFHSQATCT